MTKGAVPPEPLAEAIEIAAQVAADYVHHHHFLSKESIDRPVPGHTKSRRKVVFYRYLIIKQRVA